MMRNTTAQRVYPPNVPYIVYPPFTRVILQPMFGGSMTPGAFDPAAAPILYAILVRRPSHAQLGRAPPTGDHANTSTIKKIPFMSNPILRTSLRVEHDRSRMLQPPTRLGEQ